MKQRTAVFMLAPLAIFFVIAVTNLYYAKFMYRPSQNVFINDADQDYNKLIGDLKKGHSDATPSQISQVLIDERKVVQNCKDSIDTDHEAFQWNGYAIFSGAFLYLYVILRINSMLKNSQKV